jgi:hypothetical protein
MIKEGDKKVFTTEHAEAAEMNIEEKLNKITDNIHRVLGPRERQSKHYRADLVE